MPVERLRMRPWLENIINNRKYPGVEWLDEEQKIFRLPWKHASRNGWKINTDASLFRAWAEHTGKYKGDKEKPNPKIWKANFRCALNSLPDMEEVAERRSTKGSNAFKVYRMIEKMDSAEAKKNNSKKYKGRYQRRKRPYSRTTSTPKEEKLESKEGLQLELQLPQEEQSEIMEPGEITTGFPYSVPQACYKQHLVDHDYALTRYFDLFDGAADEEMSDVLDAPDCKVIKTEPISPMRRENEEYSFYEYGNGNSKKLDDGDFLNESDDKVMSDDEVIDLIEEMSSECDSSAGSLDTMDELLDVDKFEPSFEHPKQRSISAPACSETSLETVPVLQPFMPIAKSKSFPDIHSIMSTSPQEFLQSCLS